MSWRRLGQYLLAGVAIVALQMLLRRPGGFCDYVLSAAIAVVVFAVVDFVSRRRTKGSVHP